MIWLSYIWCALFHGRDWDFVRAAAPTRIYGQYRCQRCGKTHVARIR